MKYTKLVIVLALAVLAMGLVFAQGVPQDNGVRAKQYFQTKQRVLRAKSCFRLKQQMLRGGVINKEQAAKARYMMKRMAWHGHRAYDQYSYQGGRHITGRGLEKTGAVTYPKGEYLYRMGRRDTHPAMQAGDNRGKQAFIGKQMLQNCPLREKMQRHAQ